MFVEVFPGGSGYGLSLATNKGQEAHLGRMTEEEREEFRASDSLEWKAMTSSGAVKVHPPSMGHELRRLFPNRVVSSRMVRRWKPQPGVHSRPKAKS
eukprot:2269042-Pyramimonas_sp.AAC.1